MVTSLWKSYYSWLLHNLTTLTFKTEITDDTAFKGSNDRLAVIKGSRTPAGELEQGMEFSIADFVVIVILYYKFTA